MDMQQNDFDRILFFEHSRKTSEATYTKNPLDAGVRISSLFILLILLSEPGDC